MTKVTPDVNGRVLFSFTYVTGQRRGWAVPDRRQISSPLRSVPPQRGAGVAIFREGTLRTDVDVGNRLQYPVLLEDATIVGQ